MRTGLLLGVFDLHRLDVHDLAAAFALGKDALSIFSPDLEVFFLAAGAGKFPVILIFFRYHLYHHIMSLYDKFLA